MAPVIAARFGLKSPKSPRNSATAIARCAGGLGARWAYYKLDEVTLSGATQTYIQGDKTLATHRCLTCGCVLYWLPLPVRDEAHYDRMGVNTRMCDPKDVEGIHVRLLAGADARDLLG